MNQVTIARKPPCPLADCKIGVVVPAYNEEKLLRETVKGIPDYVTRIYIVDDGSTDKTPCISMSLSEEDRRITSIRHASNRGVGAAISTGYRWAIRDEMEVVAVMAGDNQMNPDHLLELVTPVIEGVADYSKGNRMMSRRSRQGMPRFRVFGNRILSILTKIASGYWHIMDPQNGFTAASYSVLTRLNLDTLYPYYGYCNDILVRLSVLGARVADTPIPSKYGAERSKIKYGRYVTRVAPLLFGRFLWRLKEEYLISQFHILIVFYILGMALLPLGLVVAMMSILAGVGLLQASILMIAAGILLTGGGMALEVSQDKHIARAFPDGEDDYENSI